jgi:hypothetical protein
MMHQINHEARIHQDLFVAGCLMMYFCTKCPLASRLTLNTTRRRRDPAI